MRRIKTKLKKVLVLRNLKTKIDKVLLAPVLYCSKRISYKTNCTKKSKRCSTDFFNKNYRHPERGFDNPVCCSTHLYIILKEIVSLFEKENIEYYAVYGTFLGAMRHQGLIPWDTDIDIAVFYDNKEKIVQIINNKLNHLFYITQDNKHLIRINYSRTNKVHADIYFWGKNNNEAVDYLYNQNIPLNELFPLTKRKFYDLEIYTPKTDYHLINFYGEQYMKSAVKKYYSIDKKTTMKNSNPAIINTDKFSK